MTHFKTVKSHLGRHAEILYSTRPPSLYITRQFVCRADHCAECLADRSIAVLRKRRLSHHAGLTVPEFPLHLPHVKLFVHVVQGRCRCYIIIAATGFAIEVQSIYYVGPSVPDDAHRKQNFEIKTYKKKKIVSSS